MGRMGMSVKQSLQLQGHYTPSYCEENVYHLVHHLVSEGMELDTLTVVFVSNDSKVVPFWHQSASANDEGFIVWDYHVLLMQPSAELLWDLDTTLPCPMGLHDYVRDALRPETELLPKYRRMYRWIPARDYLRGFASDRRHMVGEDGSWLAPPPESPCIKNEKNEVYTVDSYWTMQSKETETKDSCYGQVMDEFSFILHTKSAQRNEGKGVGLR